MQVFYNFYTSLSLYSLKNKNTWEQKSFLLDILFTIAKKTIFYRLIDDT